MLDMFKQLTEEQRLSKAVIAIITKAPALSAVMMIGERVVTDDPSVPTACTNGRDEWYGRAFVTSLNDAELRFLVLHEVYHKLFRHLLTWYHLYKDDHELANLACDYVINLMIQAEYGADGWVKMPEGGCYDTKYTGWNTPEVFKDLQDNKPQDGTKGAGAGGSGDNVEEPGCSAQSPKGFDQHDWEGAQGMDDEEVRDLAREIDEAVRQGALVAGKTGSGGDRNLEELLQPQVNWREVLREFVQNTCAGNDFSTWRRPNRRYMGAGIYMPSGVSEKVACIAEHNDMSGSIGKREQQIMISELVGICEAVKPDELHVSYWDTEVCGYEKYSGDELDTVASKTKPVGGGGTNVRCVPQYLHKHGINPQASIVFTDGHVYGGWGTWDHPVLWVIVDNKNAKPDHGVVVHVKSGDL